jgi:hypothetical protein
MQMLGVGGAGWERPTAALVEPGGWPAAARRRGRRPIGDCAA